MQCSKSTSDDQSHKFVKNIFWSHDRESDYSTRIIGPLQKWDSRQQSPNFAQALLICRVFDPWSIQTSRLGGVTQWFDHTASIQMPSAIYLGVNCRILPTPSAKSPRYPLNSCKTHCGKAPTNDDIAELLECFTTWMMAGCNDHATDWHRCPTSIRSSMSPRR